MKRRLLVFLVGATVVGVGIGVAVLEYVKLPPRNLAPYLERRADGHNSLIRGTAGVASGLLTRADRGERSGFAFLPGGVGAQPRRGAAPGADEAGDVVPVRSSGELQEALAKARPGERITILPGTYRFRGRALAAARAGEAGRPIVVRAETLGTVTLEFELLEGFHVTAPHWRFENLTIRGVCGSHGNCEHAFHVAGAASHFVARNNVISDFNAHFKVNGDRRQFPDAGVIYANTLYNQAVRRTGRPVTPVDLVGANAWRIEGNLITDFIKGEGDRTSYGAFVKGGGTGNRIERNVVLCEYRLRGHAGHRVGLSLGGGGSSGDVCRDGRCVPEQYEGVIRDNLVAFCSDDGIYLNRAAGSQVVHNTLIDTAGISIRFPETGGSVHGNLVDGVVRIRDGAFATVHDNHTTAASLLYLGIHPVRGLFANAAELDLTWSGAPPRCRSGDQPPDLCGRRREGSPACGAFEQISACASIAAGPAAPAGADLPATASRPARAQP